MVIIVVFLNRIKYMRIRVSCYDKKVLDFRNKEEGIKYKYFKESS